MRVKVKKKAIMRHLNLLVQSLKANHMASYMLRRPLSQAGNAFANPIHFLVNNVLICSVAGVIPHAGRPTAVTAQHNLIASICKYRGGAGGSGLMTVGTVGTLQVATQYIRPDSISAIVNYANKRE